MADDEFADVPDAGEDIEEETLPEVLAADEPTPDIAVVDDDDDGGAGGGGGAGAAVVVVVVVRGRRDDATGSATRRARVDDARGIPRRSSAATARAARVAIARRRLRSRSAPRSATRMICLLTAVGQLGEVRVKLTAGSIGEWFETHRHALGAADAMISEKARPRVTRTTSPRRRVARLLIRRAADAPARVRRPVASRVASSRARERRPRARGARATASSAPSAASNARGAAHLLHLARRQRRKLSTTSSA